MLLSDIFEEKIEMISKKSKDLFQFWRLSWISLKKIPSAFLYIFLLCFLDEDFFYINVKRKTCEGKSFTDTNNRDINLENKIRIERNLSNTNPNSTEIYSDFEHSHSFFYSYSSAVDDIRSIKLMTTPTAQSSSRLIHKLLDLTFEKETKLDKPMEIPSDPSLFLNEDIERIQQVHYF